MYYEALVVMLLVLAGLVLMQQQPLEEIKTLRAHQWVGLALIGVGIVYVYAILDRFNVLTE